MKRDEVLELLCSGPDAREAWNRIRETDTEIPNLRNADLSGLDLRRWALFSLDFRGANLSYSSLSSAALGGAILDGANLTDADLTDAVLKGASLRGSILRLATLDAVNLEGANLEAADLSGVRGLNFAKLRDSNFSNAKLIDAQMVGASFDRTIMRDADLTRANLAKVDLGRNNDFRNALFPYANLQDADLRGCDLGNGTLCHANLSNAMLAGVNLEGADLTGVCLKGAQLRAEGPTEGRFGIRKGPFENANIKGAKLREVNLHGMDLSGFDLQNTDFTNADLSEANLGHTDLTGSTLTGANLQQANLTRSRLIRCSLGGATVENAIIDDVHIQELRSTPKPPACLRLDEEGDLILRGEDAATFFTQRAILEVYLTETLSPQELGCFHFHIGEMHTLEVNPGVFFVGHRSEDQGTILRFQASSYEEIYRALHDLLAPFRMVHALDWLQSIEHVPAAKRTDAIVALANKETKRAPGRWRFAERMAEVFRGFRNARVYLLSEGLNRGVRIDMFTNQQMADKLSRAALTEPWDGYRPLTITQGPESNLFIGRSLDMSNRSEVHGDAIGSSVGSGTLNVHDITVYRNAINNSATLENDTKEKLIEARTAIEELEISEEERQEVVDELSKITAELQKPHRDPERVQRFWERIKENAPTVASILSAAASMAKLVSGG